MRRQPTMVMAILFAFAVCSLAVAGSADKKTAKKRTATGSITKVNAKARTIAVAPTQSGQQIQTQRNPKKEEKGENPEKGKQEQKKKPKKPRRMVFRVDEDTKITSRIGQQKGAKGNAPEGDDEDKFGMLGAGQLVRVVFTRETVQADSDQSQEQKQGKAKQEKAEKGAQKEGDQEKEGKKGSGQKKKRRPKSFLKALSIEILAATQQQQQSPGQQSKKK